MALGKPSPVSIALAIVMVAVIGYLSWQATSKSNDQNYTKGAVHNESSTTISPTEIVYPLAFPRCGTLMTYNPETKQAEKKK